MTTRRKYFYALSTDWAEVLCELESKIAVEYVEELAIKDWSHPRYRTWSDLPPRNPPNRRFPPRYLITSPPGRELGYGPSLREMVIRFGGNPDALPDVHPEWRPQLEWSAGTVLFDPAGDGLGQGFIDEGWLCTGHYEDESSKRIFDTVARAMQKRFANLKGTFFGPEAYRKIVEESWHFGQDGGQLDWDLSSAKTPKTWNRAVPISKR